MCLGPSINYVHGKMRHSKQAKWVKIMGEKCVFILLKYTTNKRVIETMIFFTISPAMRYVFKYSDEQCHESQTKPRKAKALYIDWDKCPVLHRKSGNLGKKIKKQDLKPSFMYTVYKNRSIMYKFRYLSLMILILLIKNNKLVMKLWSRNIDYILWKY